MSSLFLLISVPLFVLCICIFLAWFFKMRATHKERMMLIEKGMDPESRPGDTLLKNSLEKAGIVVLGFGAGMAVISILEIMGMSRMLNGPAPVAILIISTGIGMLLASKRGTGKE